MSWNYRVTHSVEEWQGTINEQVREDFFSIREVYYDSSGGIECWTEKSIGPGGETLEELRDDLHLMLKAFELPILEMKDGEIIPA